MKRYISLLLLALVLMCSCSGFEDDNTSEPPKTSQTPTPLPPPQDIPTTPGGLQNILNAHVNKQLEDLPVKPYWYYDIVAIPRGQCHTGNQPGFRLEGYLLYTEAEHVTMIDEDHVCVIGKFARDGEQPFYAYRTFKKYAYKDKPLELWIYDKTREVYYLTNSLSYKDFSDAFEVGDTMETAIAVAPGLAFDIDQRYDYKYTYGAPKPEIPTQVCHQLLEDGVLILRFEANCTTDEWDAQGKPNSALICTDMEFYPNGTAATVDGIELTILTAPANKRPPLPQDTAD